MKEPIKLTEYPINDVLDKLLRDKSAGGSIVFATDTYRHCGTGYSEYSYMTVRAIRGFASCNIQPRVYKSSYEQNERTRKKAEVFTPAWIVNKMNNLCDADWFGRENMFNRENGTSWEVNPDPVEFSGEKDWQAYVDLRRLEITCGEAPYITSLYDSATGEPILLEKRVGILDRKLRVVGENTDNEKDWLKWAARAVESVYGYEFQGDNLLIARINVLTAFCDALESKWERRATKAELIKIANIIAWNFWQMDGLTGIAPFGTEREEWFQFSLVESPPERKETKCKVYDWRAKCSVLFEKLKEEGKSIMKFDYVIGNPPYQEEDGGAQASARPVYQYFVNSAKEIAKDGFSIIMPARWYAGGKGLDDFRDCMINDKHIRSLHDYPITDDIFPNVNIRGGVCIILWCKNHNADKDNTTVFTHIGNTLTKKERQLKSNGVNIFIRYSQAVEILEKVQKTKKENSLMPQVSSRKPFGLSSNFPKESGFHDGNSNLKEPITCYSKGKNIGYVEFSEIPSHKEWIDKWKVFVPRANNIGTELNDDNLNSFVGQPNFICTESYIVIGGDLDLTEESSQNLKNYMQTKFVRFMHSLAKSSQDATAKTYMFVPLQDFTANSDIDWNKPIPEIDKQLYKKYGLSQDEIEFIETHVKEME